MLANYSRAWVLPCYVIDVTIIILLKESSFLSSSSYCYQRISWPVMGLSFLFSSSSLEFCLSGVFAAPVHDATVSMSLYTHLPCCVQQTQDVKGWFSQAEHSEVPHFLYVFKLWVFVQEVTILRNKWCTDLWI